METLKIAATASTPEVLFDFAGARLRLEGESHPENVAEFYGPLLERLQAYLDQLGETGECVFEFAFIYFNSSSAKIVMTILDHLDDAAEAGASVLVRWFYDPEDDNMLELGEEFGEDVENARFELVAAAADGG